MKEIVLISGKGGTGKTSITASFAMLGGEDVVVADCDVDAADMHLLMHPDITLSEDFYSGEVAVIEEDACTRCGKCISVCRFDAIRIIDGRYHIDPISCEGCGLCSRICPADAINNKALKAGIWYRSTIKTGATMIHAALGIGASNSGKLVAKVKNEAREVASVSNKSIILVDGPPGLGCPVVSSLSGASFAVLVTEPTLSGLYDLKRIHELIKKFKIRSGSIINKSDLNNQITDEIKRYLEVEGIELISVLPYDETFTDAMTLGKTIIESNSKEIIDKIKSSWLKINQLIIKL